MSCQDGSITRARVLILDDDEDIAQSMQDVLEDRHHDVRVVHNLDAAWRELSASAPDVFLVDLYIGALRSDQLITTVRDRLPQVRRVLVSGSGRTAWKHLLERGLVHEALPKPFRLADLIALVEGQNRSATR